MFKPAAAAVKKPAPQLTRPPIRQINCSFFVDTKTIRNSKTYKKYNIMTASRIK